MTIESLRASLRERFPALSSTTVFLDNAGASQVPACVIDAMAAYLRGSYAQLGGDYPESRAAKHTIDAAHAMVKLLLNAQGVGEAILGPSTSALCNMLAACYADVLHEEPDRNEIVVSTAGHESDVGPWMRLTKRGFTVRPWPIHAPSATLRLEDLLPLLGQRTRVVAFPQVSNILGEIVDVARVVQAVKAACGQRARVLVDGVAFAPHRPMDVRAWGCDWYAYSTYKVYGPHMAALFGRHEALHELTGPNHDFIDRKAHPYKFELGGVNHEGCAGLVALADYLCVAADAPAPVTRETIVRAFEVFTELELPLQARLMEHLSRAKGVRVWGPAHAHASRVSTISFTREGTPSATIARALNARGLGVRYGNFYSARLCDELGLDRTNGVVRASLVHYNTPDEVERLIAALQEVL